MDYARLDTRQGLAVARAEFKAISQWDVGHQFPIYMVGMKNEALIEFEYVKHILEKPPLFEGLMAQLKEFELPPPIEYPIISLLPSTTLEAAIAEQETLRVNRFFGGKKNRKKPLENRFSERFKKKMVAKNLSGQ